MSPVSVERVLQEELEQVETARALRLEEIPKRRQAGDSLIGLAFSGGGIRSATFNLGVLQALAEVRLLRAFDYVSTVSGGGYVGGWLMAWMHHQQIGIKEVEDRLSSRVYSCTNAADPAEVHFLRNYSNYLTPRKGMLGADFWAFMATYLRNTILNQIILVLLLLSGLMLPRALVYLPNQLEAIENLIDHQSHPQFFLYSQWFGILAGFALVALAVTFMGLNLIWVDAHTQKKYSWYTKQWAVQLTIVVPLILSAALLSYGISFLVDDFGILDQGTQWWRPSLLAMILYFGLWLMALLLRWISGAAKGFRGYTGPAPWLVLTTAAITGWIVGYLFVPYCRLLVRPIPDDTFNWHVFTVGTPPFVGIMLLAGIVHIGLMGTGMSDGHREWWARLAGWLMAYSMGWLLLFATAVYLPIYLARLWGAHVPSLTTGTFVWVLSTLYGVLFGKSKDTGLKDSAAPVSKKILGYAARLTPYIFIVGLLSALSIFAARIALFLTQESGQPLGELPNAFSGPALPIACVTFFLAAVILSWRVNINEFSIHHAYRNRLVRCYLGASVRNRDEQPFTGFADDDLPLGKLQIPPGSADAKDGRPLPIVNSSLNVVRGEELALQTRKARSFAFTPLYGGFTREAMGGTTWQSAYATTSESGSKRAGCENGISLGTAIAISGAAASPNMGSFSQPALAFLMTLFDVRLGWWIGNPTKEKPWRHGGPGIGFYWLLRELFGSTSDDSEYVYLSDGGHFENLAVYELVRRGCKLIVVSDASCDPGSGFGDLHNAIEHCRTDFGVEIELDPIGLARQAQGGFAERHFAAGKIRYSGSPQDDGILIYLRPALVAGDPDDLLGYNTVNPDFPHDTTANQWFDEAHFENYRYLGHISGNAAEALIREAVDRVLAPSPQA